MISLSDQVALIDCRPRDEFLTSHIKGSVNIPADQLFMRMQELPKKEVPLQLVLNAEIQDSALRFFKERSFAIVKVIDWQAITCSSEYEVEEGESDVYFWRPAPFVELCQDQYFSKHLERGENILDVACGSGRDAIYLAMQGWRVFGIDYSETALERCRQSAAYHNVKLELKQCDLEQDFHFDSLNYFPQEFSAVVICRYLHRPLLPKLKSLIKPSGLIAYQTFMRGAEKIGSPKNPRYLLEEGELATMFSDFDILLNDIEKLPDGRPLSRFVARKPLE